LSASHEAQGRHPHQSKSLPRVASACASLLENRLHRHFVCFVVPKSARLERSGGSETSQSKGHLRIRLPTEIMQRPLHLPCPTSRISGGTAQSQCGGS
jgi:hypothetical protein